MQGSLRHKGLQIDLYTLLSSVWKDVFKEYLTNKLNNKKNRNIDF